MVETLVSFVGNPKLAVLFVGAGDLRRGQGDEQQLAVARTVMTSLMHRYAVLLAAIMGVALPAAAGAATTTRVSVASDGTQGDQHSFEAAISGDGRSVAFQTKAGTLVRGDTNKRNDVFVRDTVTGRTERVSVTWRGRQIAAHSTQPAISADGRYVVFASRGGSVVRGDSNGAVDIFVRDRRKRRTVRVSVSSSGRQAVLSDRQYDWSADSGSPMISPDGRYVAFTSLAAGLVRGDTNRDGDAFVHDRRTGRTTRESVTPSGRQSCCWYSHPADITPDGRFLLFTSGAKNLVPNDTDDPDVFVRDRRRRRTTRISNAAGGGRARGPSYAGAISDDGRHVAFMAEAPDLVPGDTNGKMDVFLHDRSRRSTARISLGPNGEQLAADTGLADLSGDGRRVLMNTDAPLVADDTNGREDGYLRDLASGSTARVTVGDAGQQGGRRSGAIALTPDARYVVFWSNAARLVAGDTNRRADVFLRGPLP